MSRDALVAIDAGGSYTKATVFNLNSGTVKTHGKPVAMQRPRPGFNERDADELWEATAECVTEALAAAAVEPSRVAGVGLTGHGNGLYLVDSAGLPTRNAIMSADNRAAQVVTEWRRDGTEDAIREHAWNGLWAGKPGPVLAWLSAHEPETLAATETALGCKDYLRARLTGEVATEVTDAVAGGLYDNSALVGDADATLLASASTLSQLGIEACDRLLKPSIPSMTVTEVAPGTGTPLLPGTPVVAGMVDNTAMQHGSGVFDSSSVCVGAGTWSINQLLVPVEEMTMAGTLGAVLPFAASMGIGGYGLLSEASATSASSFAWAMERAITRRAFEAREHGQDMFAAQLDREGRRERRTNDPMYFPFIDGSREDGTARGSWLGLSSATDEDDLLGAVLEGICFEHRRHVERLERTLSQPLPVRLSGGATKSPVWCQLFADILGRPVLTSPVAEIGSVCAAAMAGVTAGLFETIEDGVAALNPTWTTFDPNTREADRVTARWDRYCRWASLLETEPWAS